MSSVSSCSPADDVLGRSSASASAAHQSLGDGGGGAELQPICNRYEAALMKL